MSDGTNIDIMEDGGSFINRFLTDPYAYKIMELLTNGRKGIKELETNFKLSERSIYRKVGFLMDNSLVKNCVDRKGVHEYYLTDYGDEVLNGYRHLMELFSCSSLFSGIEICKEKGLDIDLVPYDDKSIKAVYISNHHLGRLKVIPDNERILQYLSNIVHLARDDIIMATRYFSPVIFNALHVALVKDIPCKIIISSDYDLEDFTLTLLSYGKSKLEELNESELLKVRMANLHMSYSVVDDIYVMQEMPKAEGRAYHYFLSVESEELADFLKKTFEVSWGRSLDLNLMKILDSFSMSKNI